jgi:sulfur carrier protein
MSNSIQCKVNGQVQEWATTVTVAELLANMQLSPRNVAVEINLEIVPRALHENRTLQAGDCIEIVSLVGGG